MEMHPLISRAGMALAIGVSSLGIVRPTLAAEVEGVIRKFDPRTRELVSVDPQDVVVGKIYNHYSDRHHRYVWAYALKDDKFSYALGPGTMETPTNFALTASTEQAVQLYEQRTGVTNRNSQGADGYMVQLGEDGQWVVLESASSACRSHFDLDSGRRWEWHGNRRVAVSSTYGYTWRYVDGRYIPPHAPPCFSGLADNCHACGSPR